VELHYELFCEGIGRVVGSDEPHHSSHFRSARVGSQRGAVQVGGGARSASS
jgi:hypothetical protein